MGNMIDYIRASHKSFEERPFCKEDALVLSEFSYLNFDRLLEPVSDGCLTMEDLKKEENFESLFAHPMHGKAYRELFDAVEVSQRFQNLKISFFINYVNAEDGIQFCAMTFFLPGGITYIAFRGTDENVVGWQEDIRLALDEPVPGQRLSIKYINDVANRIGGNFMVGGHSKGGNLAMYVAMNCDENVKSRISRIYSFDGPGFRPEILEKYNFTAIKERTVSVIPKSSLVGLVLATNEDSIVVASKSIGVFQHDPMNWIIENGKLVETKLTEQHLLLINTFNEWLYSLDEEHLQGFVSALVDSLNATQATTTTEIAADIPKSLGNIMKASKEHDEETKRIIEELKKSFIAIAYENVRNDFFNKIENTKEDMMKVILEVKNVFGKGNKSDK